MAASHHKPATTLPSWTTLLYVTVLATTMLLQLVNAQGNSNSTESDDKDGPVCYKKLVEVTVPFPGVLEGYRCLHTSIKLPYCTGSCNSVAHIKAAPPYIERDCNVCSFLEIKPRRKELTFTCEHESTRERREFKRFVRLSRVQNCGCVKSSAVPKIVRRTIPRRLVS